MSELTIIPKAKHGGAYGPHSHVHVPVTRSTLAKRRWRGVAEDGREFGFDLDEPLSHGDHFYAEGDRHYVADQEPEEVLEIPVTTLEQAACIAWSLGNLHFPIQILPEAVRVAEDPAVLQLLAREHITFRRVTCVFLPLSAASHHHHHA
jgi:urease accessory protein